MSGKGKAKGGKVGGKSKTRSSRAGLQFPGGRLGVNPTMTASAVKAAVGSVNVDIHGGAICHIFKGKIEDNRFQFEWQEYDSKGTRYFGPGYFDIVNPDQQGVDTCTYVRIYTYTAGYYNRVKPQPRP